MMEDDNNFSLSLLNLLHAYSHLEQAGRQADTTPGLIWTSRPKLCTWKVQEGSMGSDHFPRGVTVRCRCRLVHIAFDFVLNAAELHAEVFGRPRFC